jgi:hypothetical protein
MKSIFSPSVILVACAVVTSGCAETRVEREFGDSVREVMSKQVYDPGAAVFPETDPVTGGDATRLEGVVQSHQGDIAEVSRVERPASLNLGDSQ